MSKNQNSYHKQDLFESGKAYQRSFNGQANSNQPNVTYPYGGGYPQSGAQVGPYGGGMPDSNLPVPIDQPSTQTPSFLDKLPLKDIKNMVDRMGGIEGIMGMATKVNSMLKTFAQMAPMIKLLAGSFMKAKTNGTSKRRRKKNPRRNTNKYSYKKKTSKKSTLKTPHKRRN